MPKRTAAGPGTPATLALTRAGIAFTTHPYEHDPAAPSYGLEAAAALGVQPSEVFKTLLVQLDGGPEPFGVGVLPVDRQLDLKAVAIALGAKKAALAATADAQRLTGYVVGGISPVGQKRALPTAIDASATTCESVYVSGGRRGFDIAVAPADLIAITGAIVAPIARA